MNCTSPRTAEPVVFLPHTSAEAHASPLTGAGRALARLPRAQRVRVACSSRTAAASTCTEGCHVQGHKPGLMSPNKPSPPNRVCTLAPTQGAQCTNTSTEATTDGEETRTPSRPEQHYTIAPSSSSSSPASRQAVGTKRKDGSSEPRTRGQGYGESTSERPAEATKSASLSAGHSAGNTRSCHQPANYSGRGSVFASILPPVNEGRKIVGFFFCMPKAAISYCERQGRGWRQESTGRTAEAWNKRGCSDP